MKNILNTENESIKIRVERIQFEIEQLEIAINQTNNEYAKNYLTQSILAKHQLITKLIYLSKWEIYLSFFEFIIDKLNTIRI